MSEQGIPYYRIVKKDDYTGIERWSSAMSLPAEFPIDNEDVMAVEMLLKGDKTTALLYRKHKHNVIKELCYRILDGK